MRYRAGAFRYAAFAAVIVSYLAVFFVINFQGFERFINMDMYGDIYVSRLMWEQKTLFPENWVFGNQFYVFATPVLAALFYGLCGSVNMAMELATTAMTLLTIASFVWMVWPLFRREEILAGVAVLLGAVVGPMVVDTIQGQIFFLMASYYAGYAITMFLVFGDYIRARRDVRLRPWGGLLALTLSFCTGMQSLRQTAIMIAPLLLVEGLRLAGAWVRERQFPRGAAWRPTLRVLACTAANLLGIVVIRWLAPAQYTIFGEMAFNSPQQLVQALKTAVTAMGTLTATRYLWEGHVLHGLIGVALLGMLAAALILGRGKKLLIGLFAASAGAAMLSSLVLSIQLRSIYLFAWYPMLAVAAMVLLASAKGRWKTICAGVLCLVLLCNLGLSYLPCARLALEDGPTQEQKVAQYLMDNGYTRLYGDWYWTARIAAWTDGAVAAGVWNAQPLHPLGYINPIDIYTEADNVQAAYLIVQGGEEALVQRARELDARLELAAEFFGGAFRLYTSDRQLMYPPQAG